MGRTRKFICHHNVMFYQYAGFGFDMAIPMLSNKKCGNVGDHTLL